MKYLISLLLSVVFCTCVLAQTADTTLVEQPDTHLFPFVAYWTVGDKYNFEITKIKNKYQNDSLVKADTSIYRSTF